jgi:AbiV family abortive infection protein
MAMIPEARLDDGKRASLANALELLQAAAALWPRRPPAATVLLYHAAEEVGKAAIIAERISSGAPLTTRDLTGHASKWSAAQRVIPARLLVLRRGFDPAGFDPAGFDMGETLSLKARDRRLYADWDQAQQKWTPPAPDPEALHVGITELTALVEEWLSGKRSP